MSVPFYVSPHQLMKDRADFAQEGVQRGKPVVIASSAEGIIFVTHNSSETLFKLSEIYDRIATGAVGRFNEFEVLRQAGIRYADTRGYAYDRADVTARGLANMYARTLGELFLSGAKPFEVEIGIGELGNSPDHDRLYRVTFDGALTEHRGILVIGAQQDLDVNATELAGMDIQQAITVVVEGLGIDPAETEAAALVRGGAQDRRRRFQRIELDQGRGH